MNKKLKDHNLINKDFLDIFEIGSNLIILIDAKGKIEFANKSYTLKSGYSERELMTLNFQDLLTTEYVGRFENLLSHYLSFEDNWQGELEHQTKDNKIYWTTSHFSKLRDKNGNLLGHFIIEFDISSIKELTIQLERKASLLYEEKLKIETIFNHVPFGILVLEQEGTILFENENLKSMFKQEFGKNLLMNSTIESYMQNELIIEIKNSLDKGFDEERIIDLKSNKHWQMNLISLELNEEEKLFIIVLRDITSFIEFEKLQKQFVTSVSHELRTPIASILLSINNYISYKDKLSEESNSNLLRIIKQNATVLKNIVEDLLIISNIDNKKLQLRNWQKIFVLEQIEHVILQLKPQIDLKNISIDENCDKNTFIFSDEERFNQILRIPIENAIKYSSEESKIIINVTNDYKGIHNPKNKEGILITIKDYGLGINSSEIKYLFKRFYRGSNVQNIQGTGIGLSILYEIINLMHGLVFIESEENKGTEVIMFLPRIEKL